MLRPVTLDICCALTVRAPALDLDRGGAAFDWPPAGGPPIAPQTIGADHADGGDFETTRERMDALGWAVGTWLGGPTREPYPGSASNGVVGKAGRDGSSAFRLTIAPGSHKVISSYLRVIVPTGGERG